MTPSGHSLSEDAAEGGGSEIQSKQEDIDVVTNDYNREAAFKDDLWANAELLNPDEKRESFVDALVVSILSITAIANSAYAIIAPFLPFEFKRKGID